MMKKKIYIAPLIEILPLNLPSILAGTNGSNEAVTGDDKAVIGGGGGYEGDYGEEGLSRRGGFWDDEDF